MKKKYKNVRKLVLLHSFRVQLRSKGNFREVTVEESIFEGNCIDLIVE